MGSKRHFARGNMPHQPQDTDVNAWQRYFAMEGNNRAWQLAVTERTTDQDREMLNAAHAAAGHWQQVGTELHHKRAVLLLAEVHALLGFGPTALAYAQEAHEYLSAVESPDWEVAYAHTVLAHAAAVGGAASLDETAYREARAALDRVADAEDRRIVEQTFALVPLPGGR